MFFYYLGKIKIRRELKWNTKFFMSRDDGSFSELFTHRGVKETDYLFGDGMGERLYFMAHDFYITLKNNKFLKGLVVEPIIVE